MDRLKRFYQAFGIALVWFMLLASVISASYIIYSYTNSPEHPEADSLPSSAPGGELSDQSTNILVVSDEYNLLLRADGYREEFTLTYIPMSTIVNVKDNILTLRKMFSDYGPDVLAQKIHVLTGVSVDYHIYISESAIGNIVNAVGGVAIDLPADIVSENIKSGAQTLSAKDAIKALRSDVQNIVAVSDAILRVLTSSERELSESEALIRNMISSNDKNGEMQLTYEAFELFEELFYKYQEYEVFAVDLSGNFQAVNGEEYFVPDTENNLKIFYEYRKKFN